MTLGEVRISKRVSLKIELDWGGTLEPADVLQIARILDWIGRATRKWKHSVRTITPQSVAAAITPARDEEASA